MTPVVGKRPRKDLVDRWREKGGSKGGEPAEWRLIAKDIA